MQNQNWTLQNIADQEDEDIEQLRSCYKRLASVLKKILEQYEHSITPCSKIDLHKGNKETENNLLEPFPFSPRKLRKMSKESSLIPFDVTASTLNCSEQEDHAMMQEIVHLLNESAC